MEAVKQKSAATVHRSAAPAPQRAPAAAARVQPPSVRAAAPARVQASSLRVSSPRDPAEKEADSTAKKVMSMSIPDRAVAFVRTAAGGVFRQITGKGKDREKELERERLKRGMPRPPSIARFADSGLFRKSVQEEEKEKRDRMKLLGQPPKVARFADGLQRKAEGLPNVGSNVQADIQAARSGGNPLPLSVRRFMEPRFDADFSGVRVHADDRAARLNRQLNARAFAVGNQVFFGKGQFQPETRGGQELIAHELTHTIQQGAAVQRMADAPAVTQAAPVQVQRLGLSDALDYFADRANLIPGFRMLTIVIGVNPVNMSRVERSAANIMRAIVEFIPGGGLITQALDRYGVFDRVGGWVEQQIRSLGMSGAMFREALDRFLDSLSWSDIFDLGGVWNRARRIFSEPVDRLIGFAAGLLEGILGFIRDAILRPLAGLAQGTRGYDLLKAILGRDPITGDPYPRNADTLIGGFMKLIGQEEIWENIKRANAISRAWTWFQGALAGLMGIVTAIPGRFMDAVRSLTLADIVVLPRAFARVGGVFLDIVGSFFSWAGAQVMGLLQIIFEVMAPAAVPYLRRAAGAFRTIISNPIGFVGNLVRAGIQGFRQFASRFLTHLRAALVGWLTGAMSGAAIYIPQGLTLREIIKFVLSVLGLTWQNIRQKLVRAVGEPAVAALETGFDIVRTLVTQGPAAAWEKIQESLSNLREMVMEQIMTFVRDRVVQAAVTRLLTSLNPAGAFIQAVIAIYNTIMFFVERLRQIAQVAASFIDSIAAIAGGVITAAANRVEQTMAGLLTLVISFLARIAGLGRVSDAVVGIVQRVRAPIDRALDRVVEWIVAQARRLGRFIAQAGLPQDPGERLRLGMAAARAAVDRLPGSRIGRIAVTGVLGAIRVRYGFRSLEPFIRDGRWGVRGEINPIGTFVSNKPAGDTAVASPSARYTIRRLLEVRNGTVTDPGALSEADAVRFKRTLQGLCRYVDSSNVSTEKEGVRLTHDTSRSRSATPFPRLDTYHGLVHATWVENMQAAVISLARRLDPGPAAQTQGATAASPPHTPRGQTVEVLALERGGSLLASELLRAREEEHRRATAQAIAEGRTPPPPLAAIPQTNIPKAEPRRTAMVPRLIPEIERIMSGRPKEQAVTIAVASAWISGTETREIMAEINSFLARGEYPNLQIQVLALAQTLGQRHAKKKGLQLTWEGKIQLVKARTPYILGEDVDYQTLLAGPDSTASVVVFRATENGMYAYELIPTPPEGRARDVILDLSAGVLRGRLPGVL